MVMRSSPAMPSEAGLAPVAMTMYLASRSRPPTSTEFGPVNRAGPWNVAMSSLRKLSSLLCGTGSVNVRLNRINSAHSMRNPVSSTPRPFMRRAQSTTSATPTRTFLGSQPRRAHVPPKGRLSIMATVHPAARHRDATVDAAVPVPMQIKSKRCVMLIQNRRSSSI